MLFPLALCIFTYVRLTTQITCGCSDGDENIVFDEDDEKDEGFLLRDKVYLTAIISR
jgi:hypothetical protein